MSGIELAGLVVGAFPLAVTAMELYQETAKATGTFWRIRTAYRKDYRSVAFCQTKLKLHMEELLGPLVSVDITDNLDLCLELLQKPGGDGWIDNSSRNPLEARLGHCYQDYLNTLEELHLLMEKLNRDFKVQNVEFGKLVADRSPASPRDDFKTKRESLIASSTKSQKPPNVTFSQPLGKDEAVANLMQKGLCKTLTSAATTSTCFGYLHDVHDDVQYRIYSDSGNEQGSQVSVSASTALESDFRPPFYRTLRYGLALKLAIAQLRFHSSPWMPRAWSLDEISLSHGNSSAGTVDFETPHVTASMDNRTPTTSEHSSRDETFWSLGVVLLELCFGKRLETHDLWSSSFARNPQDPLQRLAVAQEWARDVELEADADFAEAVHWCLQKAPIDASRIEWRKEFVQYVIQPLERCCKSMAPKKSAISSGSIALAV
ncbi:hypothetical protein KC367_g8283 [Hortaea werneckii]|nr:hypothetical protein KC367_g8283 [Hortaea werneckii]